MKRKLSLYLSIGLLLLLLADNGSSHTSAAPAFAGGESSTSATAPHNHAAGAGKPIPQDVRLTLSYPYYESFTYQTRKVGAVLDHGAAGGADGSIRPFTGEYAAQHPFAEPFPSFAATCYYVALYTPTNNRKYCYDGSGGYVTTCRWRRAARYAPPTRAASSMC